MINETLEQLGIVIPDAPKPLAAYIPALRDGNLVYTAGQLPMSQGELRYKGKLGESISEEDAYKAAQICAINCLSVIRSVAGDLENIERIIKLTVFVNSAHDFTRQPAVANGASELMVKIFGENGKHVRSAVGVSQLPLDAPVEIEMVAKLK